jgi:hypothetical protein
MEAVGGLIGSALAGLVGCEELGRLGMIDVSGCCGLCHSVEVYAPGRTYLGPCHVALPDGRTASVCCAGRKVLLRVRS